MMTEKEKYDELLKEISLLPSAETDDLYQFSLQLNDQLVKQELQTKKQ